MARSPRLRDDAAAAGGALRDLLTEHGSKRRPWSFDKKNVLSRERFVEGGSRPRDHLQPRSPQGDRGFRVSGARSSRETGPPTIERDCHFVVFAPRLWPPEPSVGRSARSPAAGGSAKDATPRSPCGEPGSLAMGRTHHLHFIRMPRPSVGGTPLRGIARATWTRGFRARDERRSWSTCRCPAARSARKESRAAAQARPLRRRTCRSHPARRSRPRGACS